MKLRVFQITLWRKSRHVAYQIMVSKIILYTREIKNIQQI